jgi:hypothetical protein
MINCPCIDCLVIPICREKSYGRLVSACHLIGEFVLITMHGKPKTPLDRDPVRLRELVRVLKPVCWKLVESEFKNKEVLSITWTQEGTTRECHR